MITLSEIKDPAIQKEWFQATGLDIQLAGTPPSKFKFVASHGRTEGGNSCLVLEMDGVTNMWILTGESQDARRAKADDVRRNLIREFGAEMY